MHIRKPRTQRRKLFQAPAHRRRKHFSAPLSPDLKKKHNANAVPVKMGDTVRVIRGDRKGFEGKITKVDRRKYKVFVEGITREKVDGATMQIPIHPSKVMITNLNLDDKWRRETLKRKSVTLKEEKLPTTPVGKEKEKEGKEKPEARKEAKKPRRKRKKKEAPTKSIPEKAKKAAKPKKPGRRRTRKKAEKGAE